MSIQSEISRISGNVSATLYAIADKGVSIPLGANSDSLATLVEQIQTGTSITVAPLSVTQNGTYTAPSGTAYSPVSVNVSGGGGGRAEKKQVNFIDYDGTILYSYTAAEANALTALPENPSHTGLVAQGWNWTLAQIKSQLANVGGDVWVGQMYITASGNTGIDVSMPKGRLSPILTICPNGTLTVNWGDNTTPDTVTGTSEVIQKAVPHTYAQAGNYTITISVVSGSFGFYGSVSSNSSYLLLRKGTRNNENRVYANCVQAIRLGSGITNIRDYPFAYCSSLVSVTIPDSVTNIGTQAFYHCYSLANVTIPNGVTNIRSSAFSNCYSLANVTIPNGVTNITGSTFSNCYSLVNVTIPDSVTNIGSSAFSNCYSLANVTIPNGVTNIESGAFQNCVGISEYHLLPTVPPTLANTSAFGSIPSDCVIYVPQGYLSAYQNATNWSTYASYMQEEP